MNAMIVQSAGTWNERQYFVAPAPNTKLEELQVLLNAGYKIDLRLGIMVKVR